VIIMHIRPIGIVVLFSATLLPGRALASPPLEAESGGDASLEVSTTAGTDGVEGEAEADAPSSGAGDRADKPWIKRWAPERNMAEIGIYGGVLLPTPNHEWFGADLDLPEQGFKPLGAVAPDIGLRAGYYPLRFFGVEAEGGVMPARLSDGSGSPLLYTVRGHLVGQLGLWSVTPFVLVGAGAVGVSSPRDVLGKDTDPALHFGGGVKIYINRYVMLRLDIRDVVSYKSGVENVFISHSPEILLGLSVTLGRKKDEAPADRDGDGILDKNDTCPDEAETVNGYQDEDGCPEKDSDGDGFWDNQDSCPAEAETVNEYKDEDGCPEADPDSDGFFDEQDSCPAEAETVNEFEDEDGCPEADPDADRFFDEKDSCPEQPESDNGYKDDDGCPDEVPKEVQDFTGTIKGITFDTDKDTIRKSSTKALDQAVEVLKANADIRIKISGHTDNQGDPTHNLDLSKRRAAAVKQYLVDHGVDAGRIETEGYGSEKPVDTNDTKTGRGNNRRIEFEILRRAR
jgi:outer membrane protein OmpA-like peptidoglycan-associated protein